MTLTKVGVFFWLVSWHKALSSEYPRWTSGYLPYDVKFLDAITPSELLATASNTGEGFFGETFIIEESKTAAAAIREAILRKQQPGNEL